MADASTKAADIAIEDLAIEDVPIPRIELSWTEHPAGHAGPVADCTLPEESAFRNERGGLR